MVKLGRKAGKDTGGDRDVIDRIKRYDKHLHRTYEYNQKKFAEISAQAQAFKFLRMATVIPEGKIGKAEVKHFKVSKSQSGATAIRAAFDNAAHYVPPGKYAKLTVGGKVMMTDTMFEKSTNHEFLTRAHGDVLITGLGLGVVLRPLLEKDAVDRILVVEKSEDVYNLVWRYVFQAVCHKVGIGRKLNIVIADAFDWHPKERFDVIWHDIWSDISEDNLPEITKLKRRYGQWLNHDNPYRWQGAWVEDRLRSTKRQFDRLEAEV